MSGTVRHALNIPTRRWTYAARPWFPDGQTPCMQGKVKGSHCQGYEVCGLISAALEMLARTSPNSVGRFLRQFAATLWSLSLTPEGDYASV